MYRLAVDSAPWARPTIMTPLPEYQVVVVVGYRRSVTVTQMTRIATANHLEVERPMDTNSYVVRPLLFSSYQMKAIAIVPFVTSRTVMKENLKSTATTTVLLGVFKLTCLLVECKMSLFRK
ncbi:hypothetical protein J6590_043625 [Homalodisca vitripennis]|nr:hypothetical protein J6590_043625 [Homalodisca vitripennis]